LNINLNKRCRIEQKTGTNETTYGTEQVTWALVAVVWCNIQDVLPSRSEELNRGVSINTQPARWCARYRSDINSAMRILIDGNVCKNRLWFSRSVLSSAALPSLADDKRVKALDKLLSVFAYTNAECENMGPKQVR